MSSQAPIVMDQGTDFVFSFTVKDENGLVVPLNGYTARSQMRKHYESNTAYDFTVTADANGVVTLSMSANTTSSLDSCAYVYDVELTNPSTNTVSRVISGRIRVKPEVTK